MFPDPCHPAGADFFRHLRANCLSSSRERPAKSAILTAYASEMRFRLCKMALMCCEETCRLSASSFWLQSFFFNKAVNWDRSRRDISRCETILRAVPINGRIRVSYLGRNKTSFMYTENLCTKQKVFIILKTPASQSLF